MDDRLTPRAKRLLFILMITPFLFTALYLVAPVLNPQIRNLPAIERHIERIQPQWLEFRRDPAYGSVRLHAWTGSNGLFGAHGYVPSQEHLEKLKAFMESTNPPRPVYVDDVRVFDLSPEEQAPIKNSEPLPGKDA